MSPRGHLMVMIADHFEPDDTESVRSWRLAYPRAAARHVDADGRHPRHTWFYDDEEPAVLDTLGKLAGKGFGEVELHLHHSNDTSDSLRALIERRKAVFAEHGALITCGDPPKVTFGLVNGKWSLDNSRGARYCGVNDELRVLAETGCYADFTFPAWGRMQPAAANRIYYAHDIRDRPKSYNCGRRVRVGGEPWGDLMIFQGPGRLSGLPAGLARFPWLRLAVELAFAPPALSAYLRPLPWKVSRWIRAGVGVAGRPDWVFVKLHCHGARGPEMRAFFSEDLLEGLWIVLERLCTKGGWELHYVTAREACNIVRAAEAGETGNPGRFRDYVIPPYRNTGQLR